MTYQVDSLSMDWEQIRVKVHCFPAPQTIEARDLFHAEWISDMLRSGTLIDPSVITSIHIQVKCLLHGWQNAPWGFCEKCDDNALDALVDLYEADLLPA